MSARQIMILGIALIAAIGALLLVRNATAPSPQLAVASEVNAPMVLVASRDIPAGTAALADALAWAPWSADALNPAFVQQSVNAKGLEDFTGAVARADVLKGEPITAQRLVKPGQQGFFAAVLKPGHRAVAMPITRATAASGFVQPGDYVDIILAREVEARGAGATRQTRSEIVLENVRVLTVGDVAKAETGAEQKPIEATVITLELTPRGAELLALSQKLGAVSVALRPIENAADAEKALAEETGRRRGANLQAQEDAGTVRVHIFGATREAAAAQSGAAQ